MLFKMTTYLLLSVESYKVYSEKQSSSQCGLFLLLLKTLLNFTRNCSSVL